jgi:hypothetical protein
MPPGFLNPEEIAAKSIPITPTKTFSPADFLTSQVPLNDPKLATRAFTGVPQNVPLVGASIGVQSNLNVPAFLTNAVQQLNQTQSMQAQMQEGFRQQLLDAVLGGNFLAAEALRATAVSPGASVAFGGAVQSPQIGQAALVQAGAAAKQAEAVSGALEGKPTFEQQKLTRELEDVKQQLGGITPGATAFGPERTQLTQKQFQIQRQLRNLQQAGPALGININSGFVPRSGLGV